MFRAFFQDGLCGHSSRNSNPMPRKKPTPKAQPPPEPNLPDSDRLDLELAATALKKRKAGAEPNQEEVRALKRVQRKKEDAQRVVILQAVPKRVYEEMSGRGTGTLHDQCATYGFKSLRHPAVNLYDWLREVHDFLALHGPRLKRQSEDENDLLGGSGGESKNLERYRKFKADNEQLTRDERLGLLIARDKIREMLAPLAASMARCGETLRAQFGEEAKAPFDDTIRQFQKLAHDLDEPPAHDLDHEKDPQPIAAGSPVAVRDGAGEKTPKHPRVRRAGNHPAQ